MGPRKRKTVFTAEPKQLADQLERYCVEGCASEDRDLVEIQSLD